jgi:hypothetical protein
LDRANRAAVSPEYSQWGKINFKLGITLKIKTEWSSSKKSRPLIGSKGIGHPSIKTKTCHLENCQWISKH